MNGWLSQWSVATIRLFIFACVLTSERHCVSSARLNRKHRSADQPLRALVINLPRRTERWESISCSLKPYVQAGDLSVEQLKATDGQTEDIPLELVSGSWKSDLNAKFEPAIKPGLTLKMSAGERACAMSHIRAWRIAANATHPILVLEDDAVPETNFTTALQPNLNDAQEAGADLLYLSYCKPSNAPWKKHTERGLMQASYLWLTTGYVIWPSAAKKILQKLPVTDPVDNFLARLTYSGVLRSFAMEGKMIYPAQARDVASDVVHTSEHAQAYLQHKKKASL